MGTSSSKPEHLFLHYARILACVAVIAIHCVGLSSATLGQGLSGQDPLSAWITQHIVVSLSIWAVPMFVMISGALLLVPESITSRHSPADLLQFYKKRFLRLGLPILIWIPAYWIFYHFWRGDPVVYNTLGRPDYLADLWQRIQVGPFDHLYFLIIIFELSLITPILRQITYHTSTYGTLAVALLFLYIGIYWPLSPLTPTLFIPYIGYYLLGAALIQLQLKASKKLSLLLTTLFFLIAAIIFHLNYFSTTINESAYAQDPLYYHHLNPFVIALTVTAFLIIQNTPAIAKIFRPFSLTTLREISRATLGMYILHPFVLALTWRALQIVLNLTTPPATLMLALIPYTILMSYSLTKFVEMVPGLRRTI